MWITVVICTRNRSASLHRTLHSFERIEQPSGPWELLIVDNGSIDGTQEVINRFRHRLPIRSEAEMKPGLSHARNKAVASARGLYMVCTDDDVVVDAGWLRAYAAAFDRWPDAALFGGRITPLLQNPVTPWFERVVPQVGFPLAARDFGEEPRRLDLDSDHMPFGANYAVRTQVQRSFPFNVELGAGTSHVGEEVTVFKAMLAAGYIGRWLPECRVEHIIGPEKQTIAYLRAWFTTLGRTMAWTSQDELRGPEIFGVPRWLWRRTAVRTVAYYRSRALSRPEIWVERLAEMAVDRGRIDHFLTQRRRRDRSS